MMTQNWHLTTTPSGGESDGATDALPGFYPATDLDAAHWIAPASWVADHLRRHDPQGQYTGERAEAVRSFAAACNAVLTALEGRGFRRSAALTEVVVAMVATYQIGGDEAPWTTGAVADAVAALR